MVFLIQKTQNKDSLAIHIKLNELVASHKLSNNHIVDVEDMTEEELEAIEKYYVKLAELANTARQIKDTFSMAEAEARHKKKQGLPGDSI